MVYLMDGFLWLNIKYGSTGHAGDTGPRVGSNRGCTVKFKHQSALKILL